VNGSENMRARILMQLRKDTSGRRIFYEEIKTRQRYALIDVVNTTTTMQGPDLQRVPFYAAPVYFVADHVNNVKSDVRSMDLTVFGREDPMIDPTRDFYFMELRRI